MFDRNSSPLGYGLSGASRRFNFSFAGALMVAAQLLALPVRAENGRDFSAFYDIQNVSTVDPAHVSLTLVLELHNHSGAQISKAQIGLFDRMRPGKLSTQLSSAVSVANGAHVKVSGSISVERSEYQRWQRGARPVLVVHFTDSHGHAIERPIELVRTPAVGALR